VGCGRPEYVNRRDVMQHQENETTRSGTENPTVSRTCSLRTLRNYNIIIGLSRCVTTGVAWMDGRSGAAGTGGKWRAAGRNRRRGRRRRGRGLRGARVQARLGRRADGQTDGPNRAKIARLARISCVTL